MDNLDPCLRAQSFPFGYQLLHNSSDSLEASRAAQAHIDRVIPPQSSRIKEVPNLDNVEPFLSDPIESEDGPPTKSTFEDLAQMKNSAYTKNEYTTALLKVVDRMLSTSWKFNPFRGCSVAAMDPPLPETRLTKEQYRWLESCKAEQKMAFDTRGQRWNARGLTHLKTTNERNQKKLTVQAWPRSIPFLDEEAFAEEVRINSFHSRDPDTTYSDNEAREMNRDVSAGTVFNDSAIFMEDEFENEVTKDSPASDYAPNSVSNEFHPRGMTMGHAGGEVSNASYLVNRLVSKEPHRMTEATPFREASVLEGSTPLLHPTLEGELVQTSLVLFDDANSQIYGVSQHHSGLCDLAEDSTVDRARENALLLEDLSWSTLYGRSPQHRPIEGAPLPADTNVITIQTERPGEDDQTDNSTGIMTETYRVATPEAPIWPPFGHRILTPPNCGPTSQEFSTPTQDRSVLPSVPTPGDPGAYSPCLVSSINDGPLRGKETELFAPTPMYSTFSSPDITATIDPAILDDGRGNDSDSSTRSTPEPPWSASRQLIQDLNTAVTLSMNANKKYDYDHSKNDGAAASTTVVFQKLDTEQDQSQHGFLPAEHPCRSLYSNSPIGPNYEDERDTSASSPVASNLERPSSGANPSPDRPALEKAQATSGIEETPPLCDPNLLPSPCYSMDELDIAASISPRSRRHHWTGDDESIHENFSANNRPKVHHEMSNVSIEVHTGSTPGDITAETLKLDQWPDPRFAAGARDLASSVTRPLNPANSVETPFSYTSTIGAALHLDLPKEAKGSGREKATNTRKRHKTNDDPPRVEEATAVGENEFLRSQSPKEPAAIFPWHNCETRAKTLPHPEENGWRLPDDSTFPTTPGKYHQCSWSPSPTVPGGSKRSRATSLISGSGNESEDNERRCSRDLTPSKTADEIADVTGNLMPTKSPARKKLGRPKKIQTAGDTTPKQIARRPKK